ncbi:TlpA disulfide reductase family protein [Flavobacterium enshiense]|uniref:TlpA family protein disulfide reductase n=1 Tax=Flavobacterium enshiense TaxID=1341165 RepID=UPI00345D4834
MKLEAKTIIIFLFCHLLTAQNKFTISGSISSQYKDADIVLSIKNSGFIPIKTKEKKGQFYFTGEIKYDYEQAFLSVNRENVNLGITSFFIGGGNIKIDIQEINKVDSLNNIHFSNVPFVKEKKIYEEMTTSYKDSSKLAFDIYSNLKRDKFKRYDKDSLWSIVSNSRKKLLAQKVKFMELFPREYISLYYFDSEIINSYHPITVNELNAIYTKFSTNLKESELGKSIGAYIKKKQSLTVGNTLPNFSFKSNKGENFDLSSFHNNKKLVLLCFWGSSCAPCIKKIPTLKTLNEKYETKDLQLISISLDSQADSWFRSLKKYEMPWLQTCDIHDYNQGRSIGKILDVNNMPQYFLIDNTGKLVYHNEQSNDDENFTVLLKILESQLQ